MKTKTRMNPKLIIIEIPKIITQQDNLHNNKFIIAQLIYWKYMNKPIITKINIIINFIIRKQSTKASGSKWTLMQ